MIGLTRDDAHVYTAHYPPAEPVTLTSITTALKALDKPAIAPWARRVTAEAAVRNLPTLVEMLKMGSEADTIKFLTSLADNRRDAKADVGTRVHALCEALVNGHEVSIAEDEAPYMAAFDAFRNDYRPRWTAVEYMVANLTVGYAGTGDDVAWLPCPVHNKECRYRFDKKTMGINDKGQPKGPYRETGLQLAAAEYAEFCGRPDDPKQYAVPQAEHCAVLALLENGKYVFVPYAVTRRTFDAFVNTLRAWEWLNGEAKSIIGQPLTSALLREAA